MKAKHKKHGVAKKQMPADALHYLYVANELNSLLCDGRIDKITMPKRDSIALFIRAGGENRCLYISADPSLPRCHLTKRTFQNPPVAPSFLMHLRKHIGGGKIENVRLLPFERVLEIKIISSTELKISSEKTLVIEIMGKYSNIILLDEHGTVSECLRHISPDVSSKRTVLPGIKLAPPPPQNKSVCDSPATVKTALNGFCGGNLCNYILKNVSGLAPVSIKEAVFEALKATEKGSLTGDEKERVAMSLCALYDETTKKPCVATLEGKVVDFFFRPYGSACESFEYFDTLNDAMEYYYSRLDEERQLSEKSKRLASILTAGIAKAEKRLATLQEKNSSCTDYENDKLFGELITANIYAVKKGAEKLEAVNYYSENGETVTIPLDKNLTPQANAQKYYKRYAKKKRTREINGIQLQKTHEELDYLESVMLSVELAASEAELDPVAAEMESAGLIVEKSQKSNKKQTLRETGATEYTVDGYKILVGKNNLQNDKITRNAKPFDLWLHTKDVHGSHVIVENKSEDFPPDNVLLTAASYAAYFSKARSADKVAVDYTFAKNVSKPKGAAAGKVIYVNQFTVFVTPKEPQR